jgi:hypothetical protein
MAIATLDQAMAGASPLNFFSKTGTVALTAGRATSLFYLGGVPSPAVAPTPGLAGAALTSYAGQIPIPAPSNNTHLHSAQFASSAQGGSVILCDRLWHNSGIVVTAITAQTINSVTWPSRDRNGATLGEGVYIGLEISTATGAGASVVSISYTNQAGTAGRTGTLNPLYAASSGAGSFYIFNLQAGDTGVRSVQTYTSTVSMTSGVVHLVAFRPLASIALVAAGVPSGIDPVTGGLPSLYDGTVPFAIFMPQTTASTQISGNVIYTQG